MANKSIALTDNILGNITASSFAASGPTAKLGTPLNPWGSATVSTLTGNLTGSVTGLLIGNAQSATSASYGVSGSYSVSGSWADSSGTASVLYPYQTYINIQTGSSFGITCSFSSSYQTLNLTLGGRTYQFTSSNFPVVGKVSAISLFINNTAATTCSFTFPALWKNLTGGWPTASIISQSSFLELQMYDTNIVFGKWHNWV
jgi:hypothetical protein